VKVSYIIFHQIMRWQWCS